MRANIAALPDGTYSCDDFLDNDGVTDTPLSIALDLTIKGDSHDARFLALRRRPATVRSTSRVRPRSPAAMSRSSTCSPTCRPMPAALAPIDFVIPDTTLLGGLGAEAGRRLHRNHPARHRHRLWRFRQGRAGARQWQARSPPSTRCRWRAGASDGRRWVMFCFFGGGLGGNPEGDGLEPRQQPDLDRDHPAGRDSGIAIPGDVHPMGAAARFRRARPPSRRARRDLRDRGAGRRRRGRIPAGRARQVSAVRRQRRRQRRAEPFRV